MPNTLHTLIIEDSEDDTLLLARYLRTEFEDLVYERIETPDQMAEALSRPWDLIISDYVLPRFSGLAALKLLKASGKDLPFIVISGQIGEETAVAAMKAGAHDYIMKDNLTRLGPAVDRELKEATVRSKQRAAESALRRSEVYHRQLAETRRTLLDELDHRVRNNLSGMRALVTMMGNGSLSTHTLTKGLLTRIEAMAIGYDILSESAWQAADLVYIIERVIKSVPEHDNLANRISYPADKVMIPTRQVGPLVIVLQELLINGIQHGSLSDNTGHVDLTWQEVTAKQKGQRKLRMTWREAGGPTVNKPHHEGIGTELIRGIARCELEGECKMNFDPQGLTCDLECGYEPCH